MQYVALTRCVDFHVINHVVKKFEIEWRKLVESLLIAPNELASKLVGSQPGPSTLAFQAFKFWAHPLA